MSSEQDQTFLALEAALSQAPVLALPNFFKMFCVGTNASDPDVGVVLMQDGHPPAYISNALGPKTRGLSTYKKEYLTILIAVDHWR